MRYSDSRKSARKVGASASSKPDSRVDDQALRVGALRGSLDLQQCLVHRKIQRSQIDHFQQSIGGHLLEVRPYGLGVADEVFGVFLEDRDHGPLIRRQPCRHKVGCQGALA